VKCLGMSVCVCVISRERVCTYVQEGVCVCLHDVFVCVCVCLHDVFVCASDHSLGCLGLSSCKSENYSVCVCKGVYVFR